MNFPHVALEALKKNADRLTKQSAGMLLSEPPQIRMLNDTVKHRYEFGASEKGGIQELLLSSNIQADGVSDFDGQKLDDTKNVVVNRIRFAYAEDAATGKAGTVKYSNLSDTVDGALQCADLHIIQDGKLIARFSVADLLNPATTNLTTSGASAQVISMEDRYYDLLEPFVLCGGKNTKINLHFAEGISLDPSGSNYGYIEVIFAGLVTYPTN